jgi:probable selenium-dependent hydroxylase accessory protein YqeC
MPAIFYQAFLSAEDKNILVIGGGGKSTLIKRLAEDSRNNGKLTVIASLFPQPFPYESNTLISKDHNLLRKQLKAELEKSKIIFIGKKIDRNLVLPFTYSELNKIINSNSSDHFFIEADNTMGRSLSGFEKVDSALPFKLQLVINVIGADAINQQRNENWTLSRNKYLLQESFLTPNQLAVMYLAHPKLLKLRKKNMRLVFFLNKVENLLVENLAIQLTKKLKLGGFDKVIMGSIFNSNLYQLK